MTRVVVVAGSMVLLPVTGCVYSLHPYNAPSRQTLQIQATAPERYMVRISEAQSYPVAPDGRVSFEVPSLPRGCAVYLFGFLKVADQRSEDVPAIHVLKDGQVVRQLSLNQVSRLLVGPETTHVLTLK